MIQELLGGNDAAGGITKADQKPKLSNNTDVSSPSSPSSSAAAVTTAAENLRCPRCDSANTKFCYYNNYNLTQPRHFCKTCRRYWTKGGALRNVPIGGGCRKNKTTAISPAVGKSLGKLKSSSSDMARTGLFSGFEHAHDHHHHHHHHQPHLSANPNLLWASSQQQQQNNYNFLSLLRANQNPNHHHHHLQNPASVKQESNNNHNNNNNNFLFGSSSSSSSMSRVTGLDTPGPAHITSSGLQSSSAYRNQIPGPPGFMHGEVQNNGLQELYQRLRSPSTSCYFPENAPLILGNMASGNATAASSAILDSAPVGTGELGFWNANNLSWPTTHDLPTTNGAYQA